MTTTQGPRDVTFEPPEGGEEQIAVQPDHVRELLRTLDRADDRSDELRRSPHTVAAVAELTACALTQPGDAEVWQVPAGAAFVAATYADAIELLGLDGGDRDTYVHPAVLAEEELLRAVSEQAPHTTAAINAVLDAQITIMADYLGVDQTPEDPTA